MPGDVIARAVPLPHGFTGLFRRAEWGADWPGSEQLADTGNPGLALRLEASVFELERFNALRFDAIERVILAFQRAIRELLERRLGFPRVAPHAPGRAAQAADHPIEMLTLATLDISSHPEAGSFDDARWALSCSRPGRAAARPTGEMCSAAGWAMGRNLAGRPVDAADLRSFRAV